MSAPHNASGTITTHGVNHHIQMVSKHFLYLILRNPPSRVSLVAQSVKKPPVMQETWVRLLGREDPLEKGQAAHFSTLGLPW